MSLKVLLVDDHPLFAKGLKYLLETRDIDVVGIAIDAQEALKKARELKPEIILLDIIMPEYSGIDVLKLIKAEMPEIKVVMLTTSEDDEHLFEAIKLGASGYLLKNLNDTELVNMITGLHRGEVPLSPELAAKLFREFRRKSTEENKPMFNKIKEAKLTRLTDRQMEVLELVAKGMTYKETGKALGLTERTVKYHMGKIIELLHMKSRAQVIAYAARMGFNGDRN